MSKGACITPLLPINTQDTGLPLLSAAIRGPLASNGSLGRRGLDDNGPPMPRSKQAPERFPCLGHYLSAVEHGRAPSLSHVREPVQ